MKLDFPINHCVMKKLLIYNNIKHVVLVSCPDHA